MGVIDNSKTNLCVGAAGYYSLTERLSQGIENGVALQPEIPPSAMLYCSQYLEAAPKTAEPTTAPISNVTDITEFTPPNPFELVPLAYQRRGLKNLWIEILETEQESNRARAEYTSLMMIAHERPQMDDLALEAATRWGNAQEKLEKLKRERVEQLDQLKLDVFSELAGRKVTPQELQTGFTAETYQMVAESFEALGEREEAGKLFEAAERASTTRGEKTIYHLRALATLVPEALADHKEDLENLFRKGLPALEVAATQFEKAEAEKAKALNDTNTFLLRLQQAQSPEEALDMEAAFQETNPKAHQTVLSNLYGLPFPQNSWELDASKIPPGSLQTVREATLLAWRLLYQINVDGGSRKRIWEREEEYDRLLATRLQETKGNLPARELLQFSGLLGEMLLHATQRGGDFESLLQEEERAALQIREKLFVQRLATIDPLLRQYEKREAGDPFYELRASLEMRQQFDGLMAQHRYSEAIDQVLPHLLMTYADSNHVQERGGALANLYPQRFQNGCLATGIDFTNNDAGLDAASREVAMFRSTRGGYEEILYSIGAGVAGGAVGCGIAALVGGGIGLLTPIPGGAEGGAAGGCKLGAWIGGGLAAGSFTHARMEQNLAAHQREVTAALRAGISQVGQREAESYRFAANLSLGFNTVWGFAFGGAGATLAKIGLRATQKPLQQAATRSAQKTVGAPITFYSGIPLDKLATTAGLMTTGVTLMGLDYFGIDEMKFNGVPQIAWGDDYRIDTPVGLAGALLLGTGTMGRLITHPEFRGQLGRFLVGALPKIPVDRALYAQSSWWGRMAIRSGLIVQTNNHLIWAGAKETLFSPFNAVFEPLERLSVPILGGDFAVQQFIDNEEWDDQHRIERTPHLSIVGGLALALAGGNRAAIKLFGIRPNGQRFYFALDRVLDMYMLHSSGNTNFIDADWYRIGMKYVSGWGIGQIRGNMLRFALARAYGNKYFHGVRLEVGRWSSSLRKMRDLTDEERALHTKILEASDRMQCNVIVTREGTLLSARGEKVGELSKREQSLLVQALNAEKKAARDQVASFEDLFNGSLTRLSIAANPTLTVTGSAAFALIHDTLIGTNYDYLRGEYLLYGDGAGYALWTLLRSISILPPRTILKNHLGWHRGAAIFVDQIPRMTIDPYFTNWTRLYAKAALWWPAFPAMVRDASEHDDVGIFLDFHTGESYVAANGVDRWNPNHFPLNYLPGLGNPEEPVVDTFADGYRVLTEKLLEGPPNGRIRKSIDHMVSLMIDEAKRRWTKKQGGNAKRSRTDQNAQTVIEHAEVYAAIAMVVRQNKPGSFEETFKNHRDWIHRVLGSDKPTTPEDVARLATEFGEFTWVGSGLREVPLIGNYLPTWPDGRSRGFDVTQN